MDEWLNRQIVNLVPMGIVSSNLTSFIITGEYNSIGRVSALQA